MNSYELQEADEQQRALRVEIAEVELKIEEYKDLLSAPLSDNLDTSQKMDALEKRCKMYTRLLSNSEHHARMLMTEVMIKQKVSEHYSNNHNMNIAGVVGGMIGFVLGAILGPILLA